jgi:hypothetical protein
MNDLDLLKHCEEVAVIASYVDNVSMLLNSVAIKMMEGIPGIKENLRDSRHICLRIIEKIEELEKENFYEKKRSGKFNSRRTSGGNSKSNRSKKKE